MNLNNFISANFNFNFRIIRIFLNLKEIREYNAQFTLDYQPLSEYFCIYFPGLEFKNYQWFLLLLYYMSHRSIGQIQSSGPSV